MKQLSFLLLSVIFSLVGICNLKAETIKGNGKIVTKEIDVRDFDEITLSMPATVNFTQSEQYSCSITMDENLVQFVSVKTVGDDLRIRQLPSKDGKPILSFSFGEKEVTWPNYQYATLQFTKFVINISAPYLEDVKVNGSGTFNFSTEFSNVKLDADVNGSGQINAEKGLRVDELDVELNGSGSVNFAQLTAKEVEVTASGSGNTTLNGALGELDLTMMGSGNIKVSGNSKNAKAKVAGTGNIHLGNVSGLIKYEIAGSGNIYYSGDAEIRGFTAGSGIIRKK